MQHRVAAILLSGGSGERAGVDGGKQLAPVAGRPVMSWSAQALDACGFDLLVVVCHPDRVDEYRSVAIKPLGLKTPVVYAPGGSTRQDSVAAGLSAITADIDIVAVHDGARPLVSPQAVLAALDVLVNSADAAGVILGHPVVDTLKVVRDGVVVETPDRSVYWAAQTPQIFRLEALLAAHDTARLDGFIGTDDASVVEHAGGVVLAHEGGRDNIKVTRPEDFAFVAAVLGGTEESGR